MMGIYIKNMEIPKDGEKLYVIVFSDGKACASYKPFEWHEVVPVPPHGRLIDADALLSLDRQIYDGEIAVGRREYIFCFEVEDAPTIIQASEVGMK